MSYLKAAILAIALLPSVAAAQTVNSAASIGARAVSSYSGIGMWGPDRATERKMAVARLEQICASKRASDQRGCDRAWRIIAAGHAKIQARRDAEADKAAKAEGVVAP